MGEVITIAVTANVANDEEAKVAVQRFIRDLTSLGVTGTVVTQHEYDLDEAVIPLGRETNLPTT